MRKISFQNGSGLELNRQQDPWRHRMPAQIYIGRETARRFNTTVQKPVTFGKRKVEPETVMRPRRFSLVRLASSLFQAPRKTRRTNAR